MKYLVTHQEMKRYDVNTTERIGIPGMVLMERAAMAVLEQIGKRFGENRHTGVLVLAGVGNNGGDGLALARLLSEAGYRVCVHCLGREDRATGQWRMQREILAHYPVRVNMAGTGSKLPEGEYTVLVDALFGVGLSRELEGDYAGAVADFNRREGFKIAVDMPSGLDADTGRVLGEAVRADLTVTFGFCKRGLVFYPGCEYAGEVVVADIGITQRSFFGEPPGMFCLDEEPSELLPARAGDGHKGTFGRLLAVAGSRNMAGAAVLCAEAAYRAGAGMVKVITPQENRIILQEKLPEALLGTEEDLEEALSWADGVVIGPGLGKSERAHECLRRVVHGSRLPLVIDADGLNLLAEDRELGEELASRQGGVVLTPHMGELARLSGESVETLKSDLPGAGMRLAEQLRCVVAAKDARTFVCAQNEPVCVNIRGNSGMATAGSGDVLAGAIGGLLVQGMPAYRAACSGVALHAAAGDAAARERGEHAVMAGDLVEKLAAPGKIQESRQYRYE